MGFHFLVVPREAISYLGPLIADDGMPVRVFAEDGTGLQ